MSGDRAIPSAAGRRLEEVRERIARAATRAGRDPESITLLAVSKTVSSEQVLELAEAGQRDFGENRVVEAGDKRLRVEEGWSGPPLTWSLIGHLQRNKVKRALEIFDRVDSVDSFRLLGGILREAETRSSPLPVLLQFNCSGESTKGGFLPEDSAKVAAELKNAPAVLPQGLMTIGPLAEEPEAARPAFRLLTRIRDEVQQTLGAALPELSMGMSGDLEIGIEEGATVVRVGTALFGSRD